LGRAGGNYRDDDGMMIDAGRRKGLISNNNRLLLRPPRLQLSTNRKRPALLKHLLDYQRSMPGSLFTQQEGHPPSSGQLVVWPQIMSTTSSSRR